MTPESFRGRTSCLESGEGDEHTVEELGMDFFHMINVCGTLRGTVAGPVPRAQMRTPAFPRKETLVRAIRTCLATVASYEVQVAGDHEGDAEQASVIGNTQCHRNDRELRLCAVWMNCPLVGFFLVAVELGADRGTGNLLGRSPVLSILQVSFQQNTVCIVSVSAGAPVAMHELKSSGVVDSGRLFHLMGVPTEPLGTPPRVRSPERNLVLPTRIAGCIHLSPMLVIRDHPVPEALKGIQV